MSERIEADSIATAKGAIGLNTKIKLILSQVLMSSCISAAPIFILFAIYFAAVSPATTQLIKNEVMHYGTKKQIEWTVQCRLNDYKSSEFKCGSSKTPDDYVAKTVIADTQAFDYKTYRKFIDTKYIPATYSGLLPNPINFFYFLFFVVTPFLFFSGYLATYLFFKKRGIEANKNKRLDGVYDIITPKELTEQLDKAGTERSGWRLAEVELPGKSMVMGIGVVGMQGSGKSLALHDLIAQSKDKNVRLIINDPSGEFYCAHFRPGIDYFFNPSLLGSVSWSIFKDLKYQYESDDISVAFLPKKEKSGGGGSEFFEDAARSLFSAIVRKLAERGETETYKIAKAFFSSTDEELAALVKGTPAAAAISGDAKGMRAGVIASAAIHLSGISMMKECNWSLSEFLDSPGNLYFVGDEARFRAVKRLMIVMLMEVIKARNVRVHHLKYLFLLDEFALLEDVQVDRHLAEKRKFGVGIVVGLQATTQLNTTMSKERAETTMNVFGTLLQLKAPDANAQKAAEARFGQQTKQMIGGSQNFAVSEEKNALSMSHNQQDKPLIMGAKFGMLEPLTGYMQVIGYPAVSVDFRNWIKSGYADTINASKRDYPEKDKQYLIHARTSSSSDPEAASGELDELLDDEVADLPTDSDSSTAKQTGSSKDADPFDMFANE
jgi:hypothetical protein